MAGGTLGTTLYIDRDEYFQIPSIARKISKYLKEEELLEMLAKIVKRAETNNDKDTIKSVTSEIIRSRHFSESFLLNFVEYVSRDDIMVHHEDNIMSGEYSTLALVYEIKTE